MFYKNSFLLILKYFGYIFFLNEDGTNNKFILFFYFIQFMLFAILNNTIVNGWTFKEFTKQIYQKSLIMRNLNIPNIHYVS